MPTIEELNQEINSVGGDLLNCIIQARERANMGLRNMTMAEEMYKEIKTSKQQLEDIMSMINYVTQEYKNICDYAEKRKVRSEKVLKAAVVEAGYIVPDSDTRGIALSIEGKTASIIQGEDQDINLREGGAYRVVMGLLLRYVCLKQQPDKIQCIFLDEVFGTLSDETKDKTREVIRAMGEDIAIVGIEQTDYIFSGMEKEVYECQKGSDRITTVRRVK